MSKSDRQIVFTAPRLPRRIMLTLSVLAVAAAGMMTASAAAQSRPTPLGIVITSATTLTPEQTNQVKAYADYYTAMIRNASARPEDVELARAELIRPLNNPGVSPTFRFDYSRLVVPELEKVLGGANLHASCNAMIIASHLGSDRAANFLLQHIDKIGQPTWQLRLRAASACSLLLASDALDARKTQQAVERLRDAASHEDHPLILRHQLAAIDAADRHTLQPTERQSIRATLADAIVAAAGQLEKIVAGQDAAKADPVIEALATAISPLRQKYINNSVVSAAEARALGQKVAPGVGMMMAAVAARWDAAQADPNLKRSFRVVVSVSETFLGQIDANVRGDTPPQTALRSAWESGDRAKFDADLQKWKSLLQQPSYAKR